MSHHLLFILLQFFLVNPGHLFPEHTTGFIMVTPAPDPWVYPVEISFGWLSVQKMQMCASVKCGRCPVLIPCWQAQGLSLRLHVDVLSSDRDFAVSGLCLHCLFVKRHILWHLCKPPAWGLLCWRQRGAISSLIMVISENPKRFWTQELPT